MSAYFKYTCAAPDGTVKTKTLSKRLYSRDTALDCADDWKKLVRAGKYQEAIDLKPHLAVEEITGKRLKDPEVDVMSLFPKKDVTDIELPTNGGASFLLCGASRSGKSTAMCYLWEHYFKKCITILTTGSHQAEIYKPLHKACAVSPEFFPELLKESMKLNKESNNKYPILHILDDMLDGRNTKPLVKLCTIGRNNGQNSIICVQDLTMINTIGRANINYVLLFKLNSDLSIEKVVKTWLRHFLPGKMKLVDMYKLYRKLTEDHHFIVIDTLDNKIFRCKLDID